MAAAPLPVFLMVRELGIGGCERDLSKIARHLDRRRFLPHVGCFYQEGLRAPELREAGIPVVEFPVRSFASLGALRQALELRRYLRREGIRVVHCFDVPTVIFGVPVARWAGVPAVASRLWHAASIAPRDWKLAHWGEGLAQKIVVNSEDTGREVLAGGTAADRIVLSHNGVETSIFHPPEEGFARVAPAAGAELVIGSVCALRREKRLDLLIEAFAQLGELRSRLKLVLVGSGPMEAEWKALAERLGLGGQCHFEPARSSVAEWMRSMDIFVLPSDTESFPNALLEAMACGCAVIGSRVGGIPEMIAPPAGGQVFESGNPTDLKEKLAIAVEDSQRRKAWQAAAGERARQQFSMELAARRMEKLYGQLAEPGGEPGSTRL